ncbi:MAG: HD domain-containing protein [Caldimicrobium sp.]|nr:HD domain-containing protein [Caldimicrobium sp.]MDW8183338.1 HD domain-containing protein [Caldimicrobium sp.]
MWIKLGEKERAKFLELLHFPRKDDLLLALRELSGYEDVYIVGGALRDFFFDKKVVDLDLTIKGEPQRISQFLAQRTGYTPVTLSEEFGIFRLSKDKHNIDITPYKGGTIEEDLAERDFTMNSLALPLSNLFEGPFCIYDPLGGYKDLKSSIIRTIGEKNLEDDPLRILRGYRFLAQGYGEIEHVTRGYFRKHKEALTRVAPERISMELKLILLTSQANLAFKVMDEDGLLEVIFPEIKPSRGLPQPTFHHLDVLSHSLEALRAAELILESPEAYLNLEITPSQLMEEDTLVSVKLASFLHDLGKGFTFERGDDRITFYGHEKTGASLWEKRGELLRFKNEIIEKVSRLIKNHMRPCHLLNEWQEGKLTLRAKRNLIKDQPDLYELWVVSLADSLASKGPDKEPDYEEKLNHFFHDLVHLKEELERIFKRERILTGKDLLGLGFKPGPIFKVILEEVELKFLEGAIRTKEEALDYVLKRFSLELTDATT